MPSLTEWLKRKFRNVASELTRSAPDPQTPTRKRTEQARSGFIPAARKIMRRAPKMAAPVHAAASFLSHTLDWLNLWHDHSTVQDDMNDDFHQIEQDQLYPHL
jgi:hypothetical protein